MKNKLLIVVDYQNDFVTGALPCGSDAIAIEDNIIAKVKQYKESGHNILATLDTHTQSYDKTLESKHFPPHCISESFGHKLYGKLAEEDIKTIEKHTFGSMNLHKHPFCKQADEIEVVGVSTNVCVLHNIVLLYNAYPDKKISVDAKCCASFDKRLHENALEIMKGFGVEVYNI